MTGRGRSRGRGGNVKETPAPTVAPQQPAQNVQTNGGSQSVARGRGRGRGSSVPGDQGANTQSQSVDNAGRGRGRGVEPDPISTEVSRPRGAVGGVNINGRNGCDRMGKNELCEKIEGLTVSGRGDQRPERRQERKPNRHAEENLSSGHFNDFKINTSSIQGQDVQLYANAVSLFPPTKMETPIGRMYQVEFNPHLDGRKIRIAIVKSNAKEKLGGEYVLYDGGSTLYTGSLISGEKGTVEFDHETKRGEMIHVVCTHRSDVFAGGNENLRICGVLMKKGLSLLNYTPFGRHHFDPQSKIDLRNGYELWPGYSTAVNTYDGGLMLVADTVFKLASVKTVYEELLELHYQNSNNAEAFQDQALRKVVGRIVYTKYNQKRHRVDDINFQATPNDTFIKKGEKISFLEYYQQMYNLEIKDSKQPLLISQPKEADRKRGMDQPILLIPELCYITGISDEQKADFRFTKQMGEHTRHPPETRARNLMELVNRFSQNAEVKANFGFWNMEFQKSLVKVKGKRINSPNIFFREAVEYNKSSADFGTALRNCNFKCPVNVSDYAVFFVKKDETTAATLDSKLKQVGQGFGMAFGRCSVQLVNSPRNEDWIRKFNEAQSQANGQLKLCIFVLPDNRADRYNSIKRLCYVDCPVPSQCVLAKTLSKQQGLMSVVSKLALQINAKLGGEPWHTDFKMGEPGLQVIGMDTFHAGKNKRKSAVAMVGSLNETLSRYFSRTFLNNEEECHVIKPGLTAILNKYKDINHMYPKNIVMFRDGVGEGQFASVLATEVQAFEETLASLNCPSKFCYVIVSKRIMQRFFSHTQQGLQNPMPGTVVFDTLTKRDRFDFFLAPTSSRQGTVTPTHYNVLRDNTWFSDKGQHGKLMELAFHLSHMYFNWTGAIRVPAVCQYAHKLAALAGDNLSNTEPSNTLAETLFYL